MNHTPERQSGFDLESAKNNLAANIFSDENLKNYCKTSNQAWNKLIRLMLSDLEKDPAERNPEMIRSQLRELTQNLSQNLKTIRKVKDNEEKNISQQQIAQSAANKITAALNLLISPLEELGLKDYYTGLLADDFQINLSERNIRFHIWERFTQLTRRKGTGKIAQLENGPASVRSSLASPPTAEEIEKVKKFLEEQKARIKKKADDALARHSYVNLTRPANDTTTAAAEKPAIEAKPAAAPDQKPEAISTIEPPRASQPEEEPPRIIIPEPPVQEIQRRSPFWRKIVKGVGIAAAIFASALGLSGTQKDTTGTIAVAGASTPAKAPPPDSTANNSYVSLRVTPPAPKAAAGLSPAKAAPEPAALEPAAISTGTYGFDFSGPNFHKYKDTYFKQSLFATALNFAAENAAVKLSGQETAVEARLALYKAFLEAGLKEYEHNGAIRIFFTVRLRNLNNLLDKVKAGEFNPAKEAPFAGKETFEDRLLFNAIPQPKLKPAVDPAVHYAVETDEQKNPYIPTGLASIKQATGLSQVIASALPRIDCPSGEQRAFTECAYQTINRVAEEYKAQNPHHGATNLIHTLHDLDKKNRTTFLGKMFRMKKEIPAPAATVTAPPSLPVEPATVNSPAVKPPIEAVPAESPAPIHSLNLFESFTDDDESDWFEEGEVISENRESATVYPEWFPEEPQPARPGIMARASAFLKGLGNPSA